MAPSVGLETRRCGWQRGRKGRHSASEGADESVKRRESNERREEGKKEGRTDGRNRARNDSHGGAVAVVIAAWAVGSGWMYGSVDSDCQLRDGVCLSVVLFSSQLGCCCGVIHPMVCLL